ncbi:hypothetical protein N7474_006514 [Penicillium riverlandense]|uniref:uncharacterized protein n=1 Tax=Penicillium riverlandense TaxID=1903569 RepID=UPI00254670BC|nr:uncharacterized protein N7474_006514 [Penicillium riverlandense]KAJ5814737.1 hypothetical protein N7474_006514 [Penicillium riverlandense]
MESEVSLETEQQFWDELQAIVSKPCGTEDLIDDALRAYLGLTTQYKDGEDEYLNSEYNISRCSYKLFASSIFAAHADYVRRQIIYGLLQEDDSNILHLIASFLLFDGRQNELAFQMMNEEGVFARLLELIQALRRDEMDGGAGLHRLLMDLLYEMSRIQRVKIEDLVLVDDDFIRCLFDLIENLSYDVSDPYHYPVIRVLLVLNEQFMISAHNPADNEQTSNQLTNKVIKILSVYGGMYKTFGENIILLINREAETSLQLLTLKLLYLIFTTPSTYEYFFTNDLHVLVDILIRNLLDLPEEAAALRHTYLRVLYPLLAHTQLRQPPHYKREELRRLLSILGRSQNSDGNEAEHERILHFEDVDDTTRRLVSRCATVEWLRNVESHDNAQELSGQPSTIDAVLDEAVQTAEVETPTDIGESLEVARTLSRTSTTASSPDTVSPTRMDSRGSSAPPGHERKLSVAQRLGMNLESARSSSLSVQAVATHREKPGIITPSRKDAAHAATDANVPTIRAPKIKPEPPKSRRWRGRRLAVDDDEQEPRSAGTSSDRNTIPEGVEVNPTVTLTPTTPSSSSQPGVRRNSTTTSNLVPPVPEHARRSASNPPPAVPPPRRSAQHTPSPSHHRPAPPPPKTRRAGRAKTLTTPTDSGETGGRSASVPNEAHAIASASTCAATQQGSGTGQSPEKEGIEFSDPSHPTSPTLLISPAENSADHAHSQDGAAPPVSVEEAVQKVSLQ